ncbi:MAG TPA: tetratricopeptide repeat protein [Phycisphaerae bacterium]|nr:tetratricopeptide repeat protein [Phycisphaerae bacterium]
MVGFAGGRFELRKRWSLLLTVVCAAVSILLPNASAQQGGGDGDNGTPATQPDDQPPEKKDPTDIRNAIGNLDMVRGFRNLTKPPPAGTWQKLVNQPFYPPPVKAEKLLFHGQYGQAEAAYNALLKDEPANQTYIENDLEAILEQGHASDLKRFNEKWGQLNDVQRSTAKMARLHAGALAAAGKSDEARGVLKAFVDAHTKIDPEDGELIHAYVDYGRQLERSADYPAAAGIYGQVVAAVKAKLPADPHAATQVAFSLYRSSILAGNGQAQNQSVMFQLKKVREEDLTYWPAMLAEAEILAAAHNDRDTGQAVADVLDLNPNELQIRFLSIEHAIDGFNFDAAAQQIEEVRKRTDTAEAAAYEGRLWLKERQPEKAVAPLLEAVKKDPLMPEARGWLAGAYYLLNEPGKMKEQLAAIQVGDAASPGGGAHPVTLYEAGEILRDARQFTAAEKLYLQSQQGAAWWSEPVAALAELYLEMGEEVKAKDAYTRSYKIDPYNMRAVNQLKLLEMLQAFEQKESKTRLKAGSDQPAFIIRYQKRDEILATLALEWMEKVRPEIWDYFQVTEMDAPTIIEFFPTHAEFSVRTTGLPWIGTVGASTGNVIALDVPRTGAQTQLGTFDWARVLRHEYTHTVTLAMTDNRIPHWLTEAAAVAQEESPRDWENCQLLCSNYRAGMLFKMADLSWGFIKPKRSIDRQLAYMESQWIYEYLVKTYGKPKMLDFLQCFHDGLTEPAAWKKTYGKTPEEMDKEFLAWAATQLDEWGLPSDPLPKRDVVDAALKKDPNDKAALMQLAYLLASSGDNQHAKENLEKLVGLDPENVKARELLGAVLNTMNDKAKARELLEGVVAADPKRPVALRTLGLLAMGDQKFDDAIKWFTQLQQVRPLEDTSYSCLAGIYLTQKKNDLAIGQLVEMERHEQRDERVPRRLASLYLDAGKLPEAEAAAFRAIRINPFNAVNHQLEAQILVAEKKPEKAVEFWTNATALQPTVAAFWEGLAETKGGLGDAAGAAEAGKKAIAIDPKSKAEKWIK